jgi:tetratricopeptide (TPR) repeat protein
VKRLFPIAIGMLALVDCGAPPWQLGKPLDGRPSIPPGQAVVSPERSAVDAQEARASGRRVLEIAALERLDVADRLNDAQRKRLADLLVERASEFHALGRAIPESADLETVARLDATRGVQLTPARAVAAAAAGDAWKAIGARAEARAAYARASALGGVSPGDVGIMPRRKAVPVAARALPPADVDAYVLEGAALSSRLLPVVAAHPWLLDHQTRALAWAETLLAEDPTSPDVLELVAVIWGRARRFGGTERILMELAYHSPDRAAGIGRGAAVWDRVGRPREACAQWIRAARWRDDPEDPVWRTAVACARRDPGAGDSKAIRDYVVNRARPERRAAIAAELDGRAPTVDGGAADANTDGAAAARDGGGRDGAGQ